MLRILLLTKQKPGLASNSLVENYFGNIKKRMTTGKLRPADFIRHQYTLIRGMIKEIKTNSTDDKTGNSGRLKLRKRKRKKKKTAHQEA